MAAVTAGTAIRFEAEVCTIGTSSIVRLPSEASQRLPSRGQVAVQVDVDGHALQTVLEPDGLRGHWMNLPDGLGASTGDVVAVTVEVSPEWPEPDVPADLATALDAAPEGIRDTWQDITPMARWEWVRWVNATAHTATRQRRVEVSISKMEHGKRRPCCFDLSSCTDPSVSKNGKLLGAT